MENSKRGEENDSLEQLISLSQKGSDRHTRARQKGANQNGDQAEDPLRRAKNGRQKH